jgi:hypothetical protein
MFTWRSGSKGRSISFRTSAAAERRERDRVDDDPVGHRGDLAGDEQRLADVAEVLGLELGRLDPVEPLGLAQLRVDVEGERRGEVLGLREQLARGVGVGLGVVRLHVDVAGGDRVAADDVVDFGGESPARRGEWTR